MALIAVRGIPQKWNAYHIRGILARSIPGPFETINIVKGNGKKKTKIAYLELAPRTDPAQVIENIRIMSASKPIKLCAYIPKDVKNVRRKQNKGQGELTDAKKVLLITYREILTELQMKYPALNNLSRKTAHKLLGDIGLTVMARLKKISAAPLVGDSPTNLGAAYRKSHPHFGDFQLIVAALHRLQDAAGAPRTQLHEATLLPPKNQGGGVSHIPATKVRGSCLKYSDKISKKIAEHIDSLSTEANESDTDEDSARKRVREELKKIGPYIPLIVRQVINKHFIPEKQKNMTKICVYGEPALPARAALAPLLEKLHAGPAMRSWRSYNMLSLKVPPARLPALLAMDGTLISGAKLVIRSADIPIFKGTIVDGGWETTDGPADVEFDECMDEA